MTDFIYVLVTLVAFALLALLVGAMDRAERPAAQRSTQPSDR